MVFNRFSSISCLFTTFLCLPLTPLFATPSVSGTTITWPDDGWYQVQSAENFDTLCEGGQSCEVSPGAYIVINHTTGERWESVNVAGGSSGMPGEATPSSVEVTGNTIRWPADGWYQVQELPGYQTVCEAGLSCEVAAGEYVVINHTTGERFENITVGGSAATAAVEVNGNTISWPSDGWYQVQDEQNFQSLCEGGSSCDVPDGRYVVINHSSGERFDGITVGSGTGSTSTGDSGRDISLSRFASNAQFERTLKDALIEFYFDGGAGTGGGTTGVDTGGDGGGSISAISESTPPTLADAATGADDGVSFTETNVQETGVDEADRVKTDGRYLYVLGDNPGVIQPLPIGPVIDLPLVGQSDLASSVVPGFVEPNQTRFKVLELDPTAASATLLSDSSLQLAGSNVDGMYLNAANSDSVFLTASSHGGNYWGYWGVPWFWGETRSAVHQLNVSDRLSPQLDRSLFFDGQLVSSRVVGSHMYIALRYFPNPDALEPSSNPVPVATTVDGLELSELLPHYQRSGEDSRPLISYDDCHEITRETGLFYQPNIISLVSINLADLSVSDSICYLGQLDTLYVSPGAAFLTTTDYGPIGGIGGFGDVLPATPYYSTKTSVHQINMSDGNLSYRGSGQVDGVVPGAEQQRPFRFSHSGDYLRVVTTNDAAIQPFESSTAATQIPERSPVFVSVLKAGAAEQLELVARLPNASKPAHLGKPGERLYATRFIGNKAYLVTFRQTDPLYLVDLSNNEDPGLLGELEIEGYSDYLHPVGENHLLGIGRGAIADPRGFGEEGRGAFVTGIKLSLFDISNAASPMEIQALEIGRRGSNAEALYDHRSITYRPGQDGGPGRLAFGIDVNDIPSGDISSIAPFYRWRETGLHTFEIHVGDNAGIVPRGNMIVEAASPTNPRGPLYFGDRSVFVNDAVFYIHGDQVYGANWGSVEDFNGPY